MDWASSSAWLFMDTLGIWMAGAAILGAWGAFGKRHWFVRALVIVLASCALLPIGAFEPMLLFLFVAAASTLLLAGRRWFRSGSAPVAQTGSAQ